MELRLLPARLIPGGFQFTPPVISLIIANAVTIILAVIGSWDVLTVIFIFWAQSLIMGFFSAVSLLFADTALLSVEMGQAAGQGPANPP